MASSSSASSSSALPQTEVPAPRRATTPIEDWQPPAGSLREVASRGRDFAHFTELQSALKSNCSALWHFAQQDFAALARVAPQHAQQCQELAQLETRRFFKSQLVADLEALVRRVEDREKLQIVFVGPVNAGKTTLINQLLTSHLEVSDELLPTNFAAETSCNWKIVSSNDSSVTVSVDGHEKWRVDCEEEAAGVAKLRELSEYLDQHFSRETAGSLVTGEITVAIPLALLNPFACQYCLVDTPGHTESDTHEALVSKYLHDHSHIVCMVCSLNQGKVGVPTTMDMLSKCCGQTFWVLTHCDDVMNKRKRGCAPQQVLDKAKQLFCNEIHGFDADAKVFMHAAQALDPGGPEQQGCTQSPLPRAVAAGWLEGIRLHIKHCFVETLQQSHTLFSQSQHCIERATGIFSEYVDLKESPTGRRAALEYFEREWNLAVEEARNRLKHGVQQEIETVRTVELPVLFEQAGRCHRSSSPILPQTQYLEGLMKDMAQMLQREVKGRLRTVWERTRSQLLETAKRLADLALAQTAGLQGSSCGTVFDDFRRECGWLISYLRSVSLTSWLSQFFEFKTAYLIAKCVKEYAWSFETVEALAISVLQDSTPWKCVVTDSTKHADGHLQLLAADLHHAFVALLVRSGAPDALFPELELFKNIREDAKRVNDRIQEFANSRRDLAASANSDLQQCRDSARLEKWEDVIGATDIYARPSARTDSVKVEMLAGLLNLRCRALTMTNEFGEVLATAKVFEEIFPELLVPALYHTASKLRLRHGVSERTVVEGVHRCFERLDEQRAELEVPQELEIWFLAVAASALEDNAESLRRLLSAGKFLLVDEMKHLPSKQRVVDELVKTTCARAAASGKEIDDNVFKYLASLMQGEDLPPPEDPLVQDADQRVRTSFEEECARYATAVVNSVHLLLGSLPPSHVNISIIGLPLVLTIREQISQHPTIGPSLKRDILSALCPVDQGFVPGLRDEWVRVLGEALRGVQLPRT